MAVEKVRQRLHRTTAILESAGIPYAVAGGNAVAAWVSRVDVAAVRNTADVDILIRRSDLEAVKAAMEAEGFTHQFVFGVDLFLDGPDARPRDAVHLLFAAEKVQPHYPEPLPDVDDSVRGDHFQMVSLEALVRMKLTANRDKDRTHLRDLLEVGLIDASWVASLPPALAERLQHIIDTPNG